MRWWPGESGGAEARASLARPWIATAQGRLAMTTIGRALINSKSFLVLFFKKELLSFAGRLRGGRGTRDIAVGDCVLHGARVGA
jgi:hypothetical protein